MLETATPPRALIKFGELCGKVTVCIQSNILCQSLKYLPLQRLLPALQSCVYEPSRLVCSALASHDVLVLSPTIIALVSFYIILKNPFAFIALFSFVNRVLFYLVLIQFYH